jgi:hypothetical protein
MPLALRYALLFFAVCAAHTCSHQGALPADNSAQDILFSISICLMSEFGRLVMLSVSFACALFILSRCSGWWVFLPALQFGVLPVFTSWLWSTNSCHEVPWNYLMFYVGGTVVFILAACSGKRYPLSKGKCR